MAMLPHVADFDGCQFALKDGNQNLLKKMWRVITNMIALKAVLHGKLCHGEPVHGEARGKDLQRTERYNKKLVDTVAMAVVGANVDDDGTELYPLENDPETLEDEVTQEEAKAQQSDELPEVEPAKVLPQPEVPTIIERLRHNVTHIPMARWCVHCIAGKSVDEGHYELEPKGDADMNLIEMDYGQEKTDKDDEALPVLVAVTSTVVEELPYYVSTKVLRAHLSFMSWKTG